MKNKKKTKGADQAPFLLLATSTAWCESPNLCADENYLPPAKKRTSRARTQDTLMTTSHLRAPLLACQLPRSIHRPSRTAISGSLRRSHPPDSKLAIAKLEAMATSPKTNAEISIPLPPPAEPSRARRRPAAPTASL